MLSLRYFGFPHQLKVVVYALSEDMPIYLEERPVFKDGYVCSLDEVWVQEEYM